MSRRVAAAALLAGALLTAGCGGGSLEESDEGAMLLGLLSSGDLVDAVRYQISGNGIELVTGDFDVRAAPSMLVPHIPAAPAPYMVTMTSTAGAPVSIGCTAGTPVAVTAGQTAMATVVLYCIQSEPLYRTDTDPPQLLHCPLVNGVSASSLVGLVGGEPIRIAANAEDLDPAGTSYSWSATPGGTVAVGDAGSAVTSVSCLSAGSATLSVAVANDICRNTFEDAFVVTCAPADR